MSKVMDWLRGGWIKEPWKSKIYIFSYSFFFLLYFVYYELVFQLFIYKEISYLTMIPILFSISYGCLFQLAYKHVKRKRWDYLIGIFSSFIAFIYMLQFFYYKIFFTFLSVYSIGAVGLDVTQFYSIIFDVVCKYFIEFILFLLPIILLWFLIIKVKSFYNPEERVKRYRCYYGMVATLSYALILLISSFMRNHRVDPMDLMKDNFVMDKGVKGLGLISSVGKNIQITLVDIFFDDIALMEDVFHSDKQYASDRITKTQVDAEYDEYVTKDENNNLPSKLIGDKPTGENDTETEIEVGNVNGRDTINEIVNPIDTSPQILDINFYSLAENESNKKIKDIHLYMEEQTPSKRNEYTGLFEGYNLIMITAEAFSPYAVDKNITPTLYKLTQEGFVFNNFYTPLWWASTIDGEYVATTSLLPKQGTISFNKIANNYLPFAFGTQFSNLGYESRAYHNHSYKYYKRHLSHSNLGYDYKGVGNGLELSKYWPNSDDEMMEVTIPEYINSQPFHTYYMTISGHMNYSFTGNNMAARHKEKVSELPYSMESKAYIACNIELDLALERLLNSLEEEGIAENTVIALSADHYPYGLDKKYMDEIAGHEIEENFELYKNHFILWSKSIEEPIIVDKVSSSLDIIPTISNLFNLPFDSRLFMGKDILSDSTPIVIFANGSFITDKVKYDARNGKVIYNTEETVSDIYIKYINQEIKRKFLISSSIVETDYYKSISEYLK